MFTPDLHVLQDLSDPPGYVWSLPGVPEPRSLEPEARRVVGWTAALSTAMPAVLARARAVRGFHHAAVGLLHESVDVGLERAGNAGFGIILYAAALDRDRSQIGDELPAAVYEPIRPNNARSPSR